LIDPEFGRDVDLQSRIRDTQTVQLLPSSISLQEWHIRAMQMPYLTAAFERYERLAAYLGVETRHPLLDVRLLRLSSSLPMSQKVRGGWSKYMLRRVASSRLPDAVAWRRGWEELGWMFTENAARQIIPAHLALQDSKSDPLAQYLQRPHLAQSFGQETSEELTQLSTSFHHHQLRQWLNQYRCVA
jgi:asparagine synthetase B (glutamine-hydrolysing)